VLAAGATAPGRGVLGLGSPDCRGQMSANGHSELSMRCGAEEESSYLALERTNEHWLEGLAGLVAVTDILERLGGILAGDV
jgi:hypothetical protein